MTPLTSPSIEHIRDGALTGIRAHWKIFLLSGVLMVILGMLAIALPNISTLEVELLVGWLFSVGGILRLITLFGNRHLTEFWWSVFNGMLAIVVGTLLITRPLQGIIALTLLLSAFFVIEGVATVFLGIEFRRHVKRAGWTIFGGLAHLRRI